MSEVPLYQHCQRFPVSTIFGGKLPCTPFYPIRCEIANLIPEPRKPSILSRGVHEELFVTRLTDYSQVRTRCLVFGTNPSPVRMLGARYKSVNVSTPTRPSPLTRFAQRDCGRLLSSEFGTCKTAKAIFWPWLERLSGESLSKLLSCHLLARQRAGIPHLEHNQWKVPRRARM